MQHIEMEKRLKTCNCKRNKKANKFCKYRQTCPQFKVQPYYCDDCMHDDNTKHDHAPNSLIQGVINE